MAYAIRCISVLRLRKPHKGFKKPCALREVERSHVAIWKWVQRLAPTASRFDAPRSLVRCILLHETMIRIGESRPGYGMDSLQMRALPEMLPGFPNILA
ncbi:hypothetical protein KEJ19_04985 [Candidatus Bathyarchaeota archaeon]|nr:hypothetical protein [Candidatus Bathyarchaeota archaeon]